MKRFLKLGKRFMRLHWPKIVTAAIGCGLFFLSRHFTDQLQSLLISIAAALISIPVVFLFYELINQKNHRRIYEFVYDFVNNRTHEIVDETISAVRIIMEGYTVYFDIGHAIYGDSEEEDRVKMTKYGQVRAMGDDEDFWPADYTKDDYMRDMMAACDDMDDDYIFDFDNITIMPYLADTEYLGYQVFSLELETYCDDFDELVKNPLVLNHLEDDQLIILLRLNESLQMLCESIVNKSDLFLQTDIKVKSFRCDLFGDFNNHLGYTGGCSLFYDDGEFSTMLDNDIVVNATEELLTTVYVLNPSRIQFLGAIINEFMFWAEKWRRCELL